MSLVIVGTEITFLIKYLVNMVICTHPLDLSIVINKLRVRHLTSSLPLLIKRYAIKIIKP